VTRASTDGSTRTGRAPQANAFAPRLVRTTSTREAPATQAFTPVTPGRVDQARIMKNVASGAAHDLANILSVMSISLNRLMPNSTQSARPEAIRSLRADVAYLTGLACELQLAATECQTPHADRKTRLAAWWPDMQALLRSLHPEGVALSARIPWGLPAVCITPHHLTQIVLNLVGNAVHAIAERTPMIIGEVAADRGKIEIVASLSELGGVTLTVSDNGAGMSPHVLARAFKPGYTTRARRGGTGLGLAMIKRLIDDCRGQVRISSVVGDGTVVTVDLPTRGIDRVPPADRSNSLSRKCV
jgi:signal transduction histidine kinase